jgi:uncharacterized protein YfaS (alpha-2-macroglobulin family)
MKLLLSILLLAPGVCRGADLAKADKLFDDGLYQDALAIYAPSAAAPGPDRLKAAYRAAESEALLFRYAEAAGRLLDLKLPPDPLWQGRLLLLRAGAGEQFLAQYGYSLPEDEQQGTKDVTKFTRAQWDKLIDADYASLLPLRADLLNYPLDKQGYFVSIKDATLDYTPTLWHFAVMRWGERLLSSRESGDEELPDAAQFVKPDYRKAYAAGAADAEKAAALYETLGEAGGFAGEYWRLRRLLIALDNTWKVKGAGEAPVRAAALDTLKGWSASFKTPLARAWAMFRAASLLHQGGELKAAADYCRKAEAEAPGSKPAAHAAALRMQIEAKELSLMPSFALPPGKGAVKVAARNLPAVYFRAWRTTPEELVSLAGNRREGWGPLRYLSQEAVRAFLARRADLQWSADMKYPAQYQRAEQESVPPPMRKGIYVIVASGDSGFEDGSSLMRAAAVNITDVLLMGTAGLTGDPEDFLYDPARPGRQAGGDLFRLYAVDAVSGRPLADAPIDAWSNRSHAGWSRAPLRTGADGAAAFSAPFPVAYPSHQYFSLDPLLERAGSYAYWGGYAAASYSVPEPVSIFVETDRPVYRPGQEVKYKATVLLREPRGWRVYDGRAAVEITASDANWQELHKKSLPLTGLGSAAGSFTVPSGRLLGRYTVSARLRDFGHDFNGSASFSVEEYKRPEFEVKLGEAARPYRYGQSAEIKGEARYYFGSPVPGAAVKYRVTRARYIPWYCWYWRWFYPASPPSEAAAGETRTGDDGKFAFSFTPKPESGPYADYPSAYTVEVEARDAGGRTIKDTRVYRAGAKAYSFDVTPDAGFFAAGRAGSLKARLMDLNEAPQEGRARYALYRLDGAPEDAPDRQGPYYLSFAPNPSLEQAFAKVPDGALADSGELRFAKDAPASLGLKPQAPGAYRLRLKADDPWGGESSSELVVVFASADAAKNKALHLPAVALFERSSYRQGETARALIGASSLKGARFVELTAGNFVLSRETLPDGGLSVYNVKVGPTQAGGFGLRWLGAGDFRFYSGMGDARVPREDKDLALELRYDKVLAPGQKASWSLRAKDGSGRPVSGEALVKVFDRSLEYYGADDGFWGAGLYPDRRTYGGAGHSSIFSPPAVELPLTGIALERMYRSYRVAAAEETLPSLRMAGSRYGGGMFSKGLMMEAAAGMSASSLSFGARMDGGAVASVRGARAKSLDKAAPAAPGAAPEEARETMADNAADTAGAAPPPEVKVRTDFSETAYYEPQLKVLDGKGDFSFRIPERLTSWKISSYVLTRNAARGSFAAEAVTKKDLMVRLDIPRFFREGDRSRLTALVTNDTAGELSGEVTLSVTRDGEDAAAAFKAGKAARAFTVKPNGTASVAWDIEAPRGSAAYKVRAVARSGQLADAQENDLPVLPSRERLIASAVAALDGNSSKTFSLPELEAADASREVEALHLEVQPQLALTVLNSLPFLVRYPYECTEQLMNRYVPMAIVNSFYDKYPQLRAAAAKVPRRDTITPAWERDNPVRLMSLMETPWENESRGRKSSLPSIDMLDPKTVAAEREDALGKLKSYQNPDGSFPWFPGGRSSLYMTVYALDGLAEAARYGVPVPREMAQRALAYVISEIPGYMKGDGEHLALSLYAAYVITSFPKSWPESRTALQYAKVWADFADRHAAALTPFGRAYAAYVYMRLGEKAKAESYLDRAMDGARSDDIAGVYWTPEKISWLWYSDTVEKHAFILRTLLALRPNDRKIPGLVRWLLFNRKASEWKSTKASAAAIYSLLDVMKAKGALDKGDSYAVKWGASVENVELQPYSWVAAPLRWSKYGAETSQKGALAPVVTKKGPGLAFAAFTGIYTTEKPAAESPAGMMNVSRSYFLREKSGQGYSLKPLSSGDTVAVGDEIEVHLTVATRSQFEYVHLKDPKPAGFEAEELNSGWKWEQLARYEEPRDSLTNFFMEWLPHGEYVLKYRLRPTVPGSFRLGAALMQSMYAPEFAAHSAGMQINVK